MLTFRDDGTIEIEFDGPDDTTTLVTIRPPKYGAYKRIRRERERIAEALQREMDDLPVLDSMPGDSDETDEAKAKRAELRPLYRERRRLLEDMTSASLQETWRFILLGNRVPPEDDGSGTGTQTSGSGDFDGLGEPRPPTDFDEWPAALFVDAGDLTLDSNGNVIRLNETLLDAVHKHWGKVRSRSGSTVPNPANN